MKMNHVNNIFSTFPPLIVTFKQLKLFSVTHKRWSKLKFEHLKLLP